MVHCSSLTDSSERKSLRDGLGNVNASLFNESQDLRHVLSAPIYQQSDYAAPNLTSSSSETASNLKLTAHQLSDVDIGKLARRRNSHLSRMIHA